MTRIREEVPVAPLPALGHIWDVMLVWRKGNVNRTVSLYYSIVYFIMVHNRMGSFTGRSAGLGFDLAWFNSLSSKHLCIFSLHSAIHVLKFFWFWFAFWFGFLKNSDLVRNEFGSVPLKKTRFVSDIIVIYYSCNSWVVNLQHILHSLPFGELSLVGLALDLLD